MRKMAPRADAALSVCHCSPSRCTKRLTLRRAPNQFALPITHRVLLTGTRRHALSRPRTKTISKQPMRFRKLTRTWPVVAGDRAILRNGIAYAPSRAPDNIKNAIWSSLNTLRRKPYVWGGGHGSFNDYGYDCSGAVSFALHYAGLLDAPLPSNDFRRYGKRGRGRWITIYSRRWAHLRHHRRFAPRYYRVCAMAARSDRAGMRMDATRTASTHVILPAGRAIRVPCARTRFSPWRGLLPLLPPPQFKSKCCPPE